MDNPNRWSNQYMVLFHDNHTLEKHFDHIGLNLSSSPHFKDYSLGCKVTMDDRTRDDLVRCDSRVIRVETSSPIILGSWEKAEEVWEQRVSSALKLNGATLKLQSPHY